MRTTEGLPWRDNYLLGHARMDDTHREFVAVVDTLLTCADADFAARLRAFIVPRRSAFRRGAGDEGGHRFSCDRLSRRRPRGGLQVGA